MNTKARIVPTLKNIEIESYNDDMISFTYGKDRSDRSGRSARIVRM